MTFLGGGWRWRLPPSCRYGIIIFPSQVSAESIVAMVPFLQSKVGREKKKRHIEDCRQKACRCNAYGGVRRINFLFYRRFAYRRDAGNTFVPFECDSTTESSSNPTKVASAAILPTNNRIPLRPCQQDAYSYVHMNSKNKQEKALSQEYKRFADFGLTSHDVDTCLERIQQSDIIIHFSEYTLSQLIGDTHYRSLFEVGRSSGMSNRVVRNAWEREMFRGSYGACHPTERPKYGCLNVTGCKAGVVEAAQRYGPLYLTLQRNVRYRCTFSGNDTSYPGFRELGTHKYYAHILSRYSLAEVEAILGKPLRHEPSSSSSRLTKKSPLFGYKEVQIHGPVCLRHDIHSITVPGRCETATASLRQMVRVFQEKNQCAVRWQGDDVGQQSIDT